MLRKRHKHRAIRADPTFLTAACCWCGGLCNWRSRAAALDGSVRLFDLRSLQHSTIIYESPDLTPLLRLAWNKQDTNYLVTMGMDSRDVIVLDVRLPSKPVALLSSHQSSLNAIEWAPHSSCHVCSAGDDSQALIWDISKIPNGVDDPILAYSAEGEINNLKWSSAQPDWIAIAFNRKLQILRV